MRKLDSLAATGAHKKGLLGKFRSKAIASAAPLTGRFRRDEKGAIHLMTAFLAIPLVMAAAVALDTAELYRAQQNFQQAADGAVLATANMFADGASEEESREAGERIFDGNMANLGMSNGEISFTFPADCTEGVITAQVDGVHPLFFPGVHGLGSGKNGAGAAIPVDASAQCPNTTFEVAMVLDTSGSMNWSIAGDPNSKPKIETLRAAAKELVTDLFEAGKNVPKAKPVQFAVVPFSGMVNVGYNNRNQAWMDKQGKSPIHHQDLDWTWDTARNPKARDGGWKNGNTNQWLTRMTLFDDLNIQWGGCIQARPYPHSTEDTAPNQSNPETLFVPAFAPDEPERLNGYQAMRDVRNPRPECIRWQYRSRRDRTIICSRWSDGQRGSTNNAGNPTVPSYNDGYYYVQGKYQFTKIEPAGYNISGEQRFINDYIYDDGNMPDDNECRGSIFHEKCSGSVAAQLKRQAYTFKYAGRSVSGHGSTKGPNYSCSAPPLLSLSDNENTVNNMINGLTASGSTNVVAGAAWGWRTISSGQPFAGRSETERDNRKIMIVMTDGQNTYYPPNTLNGGVSNANKTTYNGFGYGKNDDGVNDPANGDGFMFDGFTKYPNPGHNSQTYTEAMDSHLLKTCNNAKQTGVTIYSIAFDVADGSSIKETLEACASDATAGGQTYYYDAKDSAKLSEAFKAIAGSIKRLKLVK